MEWWQAILLGIVQGLTEFLPVSSSGHLMIFKELLGADAEGFLDFTVTVHFATMLSTVVVFWSAIWNLLKGLFRFRYNDETDYVLKLLVSVILSAQCTDKRVNLVTPALFAAYPTVEALLERK